MSAAGIYNRFSRRAVDVYARETQSQRDESSEATKPTEHDSDSTPKTRSETEKRDGPTTDGNGNDHSKPTRPPTEEPNLTSKPTGRPGTSDNSHGKSDGSLTVTDTESTLPTSDRTSASPTKTSTSEEPTETETTTTTTTTRSPDPTTTTTTTTTTTSSSPSPTTTESTTTVPTTTAPTTSSTTINSSTLLPTTTSTLTSTTSILPTTTTTISSMLSTISSTPSLTTIPSFISTASTLSPTSMIPQSTMQPAMENAAHSSPNAGTIAGAVVGSVAGAALLGLAAFFIRKKNVNKKRQSQLSADVFGDYHSQSPWGQDAAMGGASETHRRTLNRTSGTQSAGTMPASPVMYNSVPPNHPNNHYYHDGNAIAPESVGYSYAQEMGNHEYPAAQPGLYGHGRFPSQDTTPSDHAGYSYPVAGMADNGAGLYPYGQQPFDKPNEMDEHR